MNAEEIEANFLSCEGEIFKYNQGGKMCLKNNRTTKKTNSKHKPQLIQ